MAGYDVGAVRRSKASPRGRDSNYLLSTESGQFILTLYEKRVDPADLPFFLGLMEHSRHAASTVRCRCATASAARSAASPAALRDGHFSLRPVGATAAGRALPPPSQGPRRTASCRGGIFLTRRNALSIGGWRPLFEMCDGRADKVVPGLGGEIRARARSSRGRLAA